MFAPFAWVAVELARTYVTGFPWDLLGTTQIDNIPLSRLATFTGVYGISFEIALVNTAVAAAFLVPRARRNMLLAASLAAALILHAGKYRSYLLSWPAITASRWCSRTSRSSIPTHGRSNYLQQTLSELRALSVRPPQREAGTPPA